MPHPIDAPVLVPAHPHPPAPAFSTGGPAAFRTAAVVPAVVPAVVMAIIAILTGLGHISPAAAQHQQQPSTPTDLGWSDDLDAPPDAARRPDRDHGSAAGPKRSADALETAPLSALPRHSLIAPAPEPRTRAVSVFDTRWDRVVTQGANFEFSGLKPEVMARMDFDTHRLFFGSVDARMQLHAGVQWPLIVEESTEWRRQDEPPIERFGIAALLGVTVFDDRGRNGAFDYVSLVVKYALSPEMGPMLANHFGLEFRATFLDHVKVREAGSNVDAILDWRLTWGPFLLVMPIRGFFQIGVGLGAEPFTRLALRWDLWLPVKTPAREFVESKARAVRGTDDPHIIAVLGIESEWRYMHNAPNRDRTWVFVGLEVESGLFVHLRWRTSGDVPYDFGTTIGWRF